MSNAEQGMVERVCAQFERTGAVLPPHFSDAERELCEAIIRRSGGISDDEIERLINKDATVAIAIIQWAFIVLHERKELQLDPETGHLNEASLTQLVHAAGLVVGYIAFRKVLSERRHERERAQYGR